MTDVNLRKLIASVFANTCMTAALLAALPLPASAQSDIEFTDAEKHFLKARSEFRQEAELPTPAKQYMLALAHDVDGELAADPKRAEKLYILAANGGHPDAQEHLIEASRESKSRIGIDAKQLAQWKSQARKDKDALRAELLARAEKSDRAAEYAMSRILSDAPQRAQSFEYLKRSAEAGYISAQLNLAYKYERGLDGIEQSAANSKSWFLKAAAQLRPMAEKGNPFAARALGSLSERGEGVPYDPELAAVLFQIAHRTLTPSDRESRQQHELLWNLAPERLERVKAVAAKWQPGQALPRDMRQAICTSSDFIQPGFDRQRAQAEFADFQERLRQAMDGVNDLEVSRIGESAALDAVRQAFSHTIASSTKGESLLASIAQPSPRGVVSPLGTMFGKLSSKACPVGSGGTFADDGHSIELWYVDLDPEDRGALEAFTPAKLPAYGSLVRGTFPAMVFTRDEGGRLQLYAMSQEMAKVLKYWWGLQVM